MNNLKVIDEYMTMYDEVNELLDDVEMDIEEFADYYEELEDTYYNSNCEECIEYMMDNCHLQCTHEYREEK